MEPNNQSYWQDITVVIVVFNSSHVIAQSLKSVEHAAEVILVDNASTDRTIEIARETLPGVRVIQNPINMGYGTANNIGFEAVTTRYGMILNPDAVVMGDGLKIVRDRLENDAGCAVSAPILQSPEGVPELYVMGFNEHYHHTLDRIPDGPFCTGFVMGAAMLWRMDVWRALGGFDEAIFLYGEDADLSLRATRAGFSIVVEPDAVVKHLGGQSEQPSKEQQWRRHWHMTWGGLYFSAKWASASAARLDAWRMVRKHGAKALFYVLVLRFNRAYTNYARADAAWTFLKGRPSWRGR